MPIVALAGGTSPTLGRALVHAIRKTSNTPVILSRHSSSSAPKATHDAAVRQVIYNNHVSLVEALRGVHTVLCVLNASDPECANAQLALLRAAVQAGVKRFAPSEFGLGPLSDSTLPRSGAKGDVSAACERSGLETTRFSCGIFMNFLGLGIDYSGDDDDGARKLRALAGLDDVGAAPVIWDIAAGTAEEPVKDDGGSPLITLTNIWDVGRFVAAACEMPLGSWEPCMGMIGETLAVEDVTELIGRVSGRPLRTSIVHRRELEARQRKEQGRDDHRDEIVARMVVQFEMLEIEDRAGAGLIDPVLNRIFPHIRPTRVEEYLQECWR